MTINEKLCLVMISYGQLWQVMTDYDHTYDHGKLVMTSINIILPIMTTYDRF